jgi:succinyl-CoA synthetase beta subunit
MSRKALNELESARLLTDAGIRLVPSVVLTEKAETLFRKTAEDLGFPVVMKILSDDILHKTDMGCVQLNITSVAEMEQAYDTILENARRNAPEARIQGILVQKMLPKGFEILLGVSTDPQFGQVIMAGLGGIYVELLRAVSMRVIPITRADAEEMINETPLKKACQGLRGVQYDREEIVDALLKLSALCESHPEIAEIDINPFILYGGGQDAVGVDAMVVVNV